MSNTPDTPHPGQKAAPRHAPAPEATTEGEPSPVPVPARLPSARVTAALAAAMLAAGVVLGAAIGPAPSSSFALGRLLPLLPALSARPSAGPSSTTAQPPSTSPAPTPAAPSEPISSTSASSAPSPTSAASAPSSPSETSTPPTSPKGAAPKASTLAPVTHVWLIELSGSSFAEAAKQPSSAPYIDTQALAAGTLLDGWSGLDASAFASDASLLSGTPPQLLDTIVQPPCPEGAAGAGCAAGTPGALSTADEFLKATVPTITANPAYRESGLIVVTFATVASSTATGLPAGASTATLTAEPPAGALLISPFATAGAKATSSFVATSPKQSLEKLLHH
jgi:hypothetical protein